MLSSCYLLQMFVFLLIYKVEFIIYNLFFKGFFMIMWNTRTYVCVFRIIIKKPWKTGYKKIINSFSSLFAKNTHDVFVYLIPIKSNDCNKTDDLVKPDKPQIKFQAKWTRKTRWRHGYCKFNVEQCQREQPIKT